MSQSTVDVQNDLRVKYGLADLLSNKISKELPKGTVFGSQQLQKIRRFVQFFVFCYVPWWTTAPVSSTAPKNDVIMIESLLSYKSTRQWTVYYVPMQH